MPVTVEQIDTGYGAGVAERRHWSMTKKKQAWLACMDLSTEASTALTDPMPRKPKDVLGPGQWRFDPDQVDADAFLYIRTTTTANGRKEHIYECKKLKKKGVELEIPVDTMRA